MVDGRAKTPDQKRAVVERILEAWLRVPSCRLGQLISNATESAGSDVFYREDEYLALDITNHVTDVEKIMAELRGAKGK